MRTILLCILMNFALSVPSFSEEQKEGAELYDSVCNDLCHQLPSPGSFTLRQWKVIMANMQKRMKQKKMTPLTEEETEKILEYVGRFSKK